MRRLPTPVIALLSTAVAVVVARVLYFHAWQIPIIQNYRGTQLFLALCLMGAPLFGLVAGLTRLAAWRSAVKGGVVCLAVAAPLFFVTSAFGRVRHSSQEKAILCNIRQLAAAADQYYLENGVTVVTHYEDLVGPDKYVKSMNQVMEEDYVSLFPLKQGAAMIVDLGHGRSVIYDEGPEPEAAVQPTVPLAASTVSADLARNEALALSATQPARNGYRGTMCASCHAKKR